MSVPRVPVGATITLGCDGVEATVPDVTDMWDWMEAITACVTDALSDPDDPPMRIRYGNPAVNIGPKECCGGIVLIRFNEQWDTDPEHWPVRANRAQLLGGTCGAEAAASFTVTYLSCVGAFKPGSRGAAPTDEAVEGSAMELMEVASALWEATLCCIKPWRRTLGSVMRNGMRPVESQGGCHGIEIDFICAVANCCTDTES